MSDAIFKLEIIPNDKKQCNKCKEFKPFTDYGDTQKRASCKSCYKKWKKKYLEKPGKKEKERQYFLRNYFKRVYGITFDEYQEMLIKQNGKCYLCKKEQDFKDFRSGKSIKLSVDHCHKTGQVRKLLCIKCNQGLGSFYENTDLLKEAIKYIDEHKL